MTTHNIGDALQQYRNVNVSSAIEESSPHRLVQMLLDGALSRIATAKGFMERNDYAGKGQSISLAISIIGGLQGSLDKEQGGEIAENLDSLYDYMTRRLFEANKDNKIEILDEVHDLLSEIRVAWIQIADKI